MAAIIGIIFTVAIFGRQFKTPTCEFAAFYAGARLAGTHYLYDQTRNREEQMRVHVYSDALSFVRLPFYAALLSPLGKLPYPAALLLWQALSVAALLAFVLLWPAPRSALVACAWSLPLLMVFMLGEDDTFLLLILAATLALYRRRPFSAGLLMSLVSIKFNLFLLLPVLLLGQRRWRMAAGASAGCVSLAAISFWVAGIGWPATMLRVITQKSILPREYLMPNLRGLLAPMTNAIWIELALGAAIAVLVYLISQRGNFEIGLVAALIGSLLVSHHAGPEDCVLLIPSILLLLKYVQGSAALYFSVLLLCPIPYAFLTFGGAPAVVTQLAFVSLLCLTYRTDVNTGPPSVPRVQAAFAS